MAQAVSRRLLTTESRDHIAVVRDLLWTEWHRVRFLSKHSFPVPVSIPSMLHIHWHISQVDSEPVRRQFCPITTMREKQVVISVIWQNYLTSGLFFLPWNDVSRLLLQFPFFRLYVAGDYNYRPSHSNWSLRKDAGLPDMAVVICFSHPCHLVDSNGINSLKTVM